jgi:hypothetical protein
MVICIEVSCSLVHGCTFIVCTSHVHCLVYIVTYWLKAKIGKQAETTVARERVCNMQQYQSQPKQRAHATTE